MAYRILPLAAIVVLLSILAARPSTPAVAQEAPPDAPSKDSNEVLTGPVQIELLDGIDQVIVRGDPRDVERAKSMLDQLVTHSKPLLTSAQRAYEASVADLKAGKASDPEAVYRWSRRMMAAQQALGGEMAAVAAKDHFRRMQALAEILTSKQPVEIAGEPGVTQRSTKPDKPANPDELKARPGADGKLRFSFNGQPWPAVLEWLATISKMSLDWQELPADFLNLTTQQAYTVPEVRDLINRHLSARGFTILQHGEVMTVVKREPIDGGLSRMAVNYYLREAESWVTAPRDHGRRRAATDLPALPPDLQRSATPPSADVFMTPADGRRVGRPQPGPADEAQQQIRVFKLKYANAKDLAPTIRGLIANLNFAVDERTNVVIIRGTQDQFQEVAELIAELDRPSSAPIKEITHPQTTPDAVDPAGASSRERSP